MRNLRVFCLPAILFAAGSQRPYFAEPSVSPDGSEIAFGTPIEVTADRYASEYFSAPSPDGA